MEAFLLNPPRRRRKASRRRGRARNDWWGQPRRHSTAAVKGWKKKGRKGGSRPRAKSRLGVRRGPRKFRSRAKPRRRKNPVYRLSSGRFTGRKTGRRVRVRRGRRHNPALGKMIAVPRLIDLPFRLPGILGTVTDAVVQGTVVGLIGVAGMWGSGKLVDLILPKSSADASPNAFVRDWARPALFAGAAAVTGGLAAAIAPRSKRVAWALIGASGPAIRSALGVLSNLISPTSTGVLAEVRAFSTGLADYLQMGEDEEGVSDYLQTEGVGAFYEAGMEGDEDEESMEDIYEAGMSEVEDEEEVLV